MEGFVLGYVLALVKCILIFFAFSVFCIICDAMSTNNAVLRFFGKLSFFLIEDDDDVSAFVFFVRCIQRVLILIGFVAFLFVSIGMPVTHYSYVHDLETNAERVEQYMSNLHPSRNFCIDAENYNEYIIEGLKKYKYLTEESANSLQKVDTDILWKRFYNNIENSKDL